MTVDLALEGQWTLRLGSAYFPTTGASLDEQQAFYDEMTRYSAGGEPRRVQEVVCIEGMSKGLTPTIKNTYTQKKMKDNQQTHLRATSYCARALVFGERRRLSSLVPTAIGRVLD